MWSVLWSRQSWCATLVAARITVPVLVCSKGIVTLPSGERSGLICKYKFASRSYSAGPMPPCKHNPCGNPPFICRIHVLWWGEQGTHCAGLLGQLFPRLRDKTFPLVTFREWSHSHQHPQLWLQSQVSTSHCWEQVAELQLMGSTVSEKRVFVKFLLFLTYFVSLQAA